MEEVFKTFARYVALGVEGAAVLLIVIGAVEALVRVLTPGFSGQATLSVRKEVWVRFAMWLLLHFRWSAKMRNLAERITRFRPLQTAIYWVQFFIVIEILTFPWSLYEGYFREHKYGLLNQTFGPWMRDQLVMAIVGIVLLFFVLVIIGAWRRFRPAVSMA